MTQQAADERAAIQSAGYSLYPPLNVYHTHADFLAWKPLGRRWKAPGDWALMSGYFSEPSIGSVISPGTDWCILRTRLGLFRCYHGPDQGQRLVPRKQGYPGGLTFAPGNSQLLLGDVVIFRGFDVEPPSRVAGLTARRDGDKVTVTWRLAADNTLTAYYRVYVGERVAAETHQLSVTLDAEKAPGSLRVTACDLYGNESAPSDVVATGDK